MSVDGMAGDGSSGRSACSPTCSAVMQRTTFGIAGLDAADAVRDHPRRALGVRLRAGGGVPRGPDPGGHRGGPVRLPRDARGQRGAAGRRSAPARRGARPADGRARQGARRPGDALVFTAVLALVPRWFPARRVPLLVAGDAILCQLGQVLSALPFAWVLHGAGWSSAFGAAALASALVAVLVLAVVRNAPAGVVVHRPAGRRCGRSSTPCGRSGGGRAPGWASSATWAPSSP